MIKPAAGQVWECNGDKIKIIGLFRDLVFFTRVGAGNDYIGIKRLLSNYEFVQQAKKLCGQQSKGDQFICVDAEDLKEIRND